MSGPKPKVTDEQIRERCRLADERGEPLQAVADDLHIALRILSKHRRRLGLSGRRNSDVRATGQRRRNERERREHPGAAHIDVLPVMGRARRHELSSQGALHRSPASVKRQLTTSDARYPEWRTERPAKARSALRSKLFRRDGPNYMKAHMKNARTARTGKRPSTDRRKATAKSRAGKQGSEYFATMYRIGPAKKSKRPRAALQALLRTRRTSAARYLVEDALDRLPGPRSRPAKPRGPQSRADLDEIRTKNLSTRQIMERFHVGERQAWRLKAKASAGPQVPRS